MLSDELYNKCFEFLRKEEVKHEIKLFMKPFIDMIHNNHKFLNYARNI